MSYRILYSTFVFIIQERSNSNERRLWIENYSQDKSTLLSGTLLFKTLVNKFMCEAVNIVRYHSARKATIFVRSIGIFSAPSGELGS